VILDKKLQFAAELTRKLNKILKIKVVNSILPTDRWANRMYKSRVRIILEILCGS